MANQSPIQHQRAALSLLLDRLVERKFRGRVELHLAGGFCRSVRIVEFLSLEEIGSVAGNVRPGSSGNGMTKG